MDNKKGYIYILRSKIWLKNYYKIGLTKNGDTKKLYERYRTAMLDIDILYFISVHDCRQMEKDIFKLLKKNRSNPKREIFFGNLKYFIFMIENNLLNNKSINFIKKFYYNKIFPFFNKILYKKKII